MSEELQRIPLSKKGQRQVTPFTGNELLFDYITGALDEERRQAVQAHLESSKEAQIDLQKIQNGLQYVDKMKAITVSHTLQERLSTPSTYLSVLFRKTRFDQWPVGLKWGLEALIVVFVIVTVLSLAPWEKVLKLKIAGSNEVVLTEISKSPIAANDLSEEVPKNAETPQFVDEGLKPKEATTAKSKVTAKATPVAVAVTAPTAVATAMTTTSTDDEGDNAAAAPATQVAENPKATAKATAVPAKVGAATIAETADESGATTAKPTGGFLYRGQLEVTNLEVVGPKIAEKITEMGGRKAGEVELGWQKNEGSAYFHFTIPEAKYGELKEFLAGYGKPRLNLEKHPRVMPDGIIRLIITVDEAKK